MWIKSRLVKSWGHITRASKKIVLPLFDGLSLYDVTSFFYEGIVEGSVTSRAGSIAYSFFLALFPGIIFFFTLIPFFPVESLEEEIFDIFKRILPPDTYEATLSTIKDVLLNKRGGLLSVGFFLAMIFSTNGISAIISNFNQTIHQIESRNFWKQLLVSFGLTIVLSVNFIVGIIVIIFSSDVLNGVLAFFGWEAISVFAVELTRYSLLILQIFIGIVLLYNYGPSGKRAWRFISPGAILATVLILVSSWAFSFYVANFNQYNKLYGSIGTLMVILLWIYLNALVLIIGFELNASIAGLKRRDSKRGLADFHGNKELP
jgi:membrane protein